MSIHEYWLLQDGGAFLLKYVLDHKLIKLHKLSKFHEIRVFFDVQENVPQLQDHFEAKIRFDTGV